MNRSGQVHKAVGLEIDSYSTVHRYIRPKNTPITQKELKNVQFNPKYKKAGNVNRTEIKENQTFNRTETELTYYLRHWL